MRQSILLPQYFQFVTCINKIKVCQKHTIFQIADFSSKKVGSASWRSALFILRILKCGPNAPSSLKIGAPGLKIGAQENQRIYLTINYTLIFFFFGGGGGMGE